MRMIPVQGVEIPRLPMLRVDVNDISNCLILQAIVHSCRKPYMMNLPN